MPPPLGVPQPQVARVARLGMGVMAFGNRKLVTQIGAVNVVESIVSAHGGNARRPVAVGPELRSDIVRVVAVHRRAARPVVAVEVLAVARGGPQRKAACGFQPPQRPQGRGGMLPLVGIVGRIETVGAEIAVLPPGLQVEEPGPPAVVGRPYECVVVGEIGIVPVAVAAAVRSRAEHREASRTHRARKIPVAIAVLAARGFETQVGGPQRRGADVHRTGVGSDARNAVDQFDGRNAVEVDGQRVGLMPGAGIGEINAVEKDHGLVERASPDEDVGLRSLASAFADIDRRSKAQGGFQSLDRRRGLGFPVEKRGVRLGVTRGSRLTPGDADFPYPQCLEDSGRVGSLRGRTLRRKQQDRHPDREDPDSHITVEAGKNRPVFATPTLEAGVLLCLDVFHLFEIWVKSEKTSQPGPAADPRFGRAKVTKKTGYTGPFV